MSIQLQHTTKLLVNTLCSVMGLPVDCFVENDMLCIVSSNDDWRMVIGVFGKTDPEEEFFMSDLESEFITNKLSKYKHLGKSGSPAHIDAVMQVARRTQIDYLQSCIESLRQSWVELYDNLKEKK